MKRIVLIVFLFSAFCFAACTPGAGGGTEHTAAPEDMLGWDFDNRFGRGYTSLIETEDAYYFVGDGEPYLYYYDKESGTRGVLCGKPECLHDEAWGDRSCNGAICAHHSSTNYYAGRIYYVSFDEVNKHVSLFSIAPDGTDRRVETPLDLNGYENVKWPDRFDLHRGKLYGYNIIHDVDDSVPATKLMIFSTDIKTGKTKELYEDVRDDGTARASMFYFGRWVYFAIGGMAPDIGEGCFRLAIYRWDTETETLEQVADSKDAVILGSSFSLYVENENSFWLGMDVVWDDPGRVYSIIDGEVKDEFTFDTWGASYILCGAAFCFDPKEERMEIRALDGSVIYEGERDMSFFDELGMNPEMVEMFGIAPAFGDSKEVFLTYFFNYDEVTRSALVRYDLTQKEPKAELLAYCPRG